MAFDKDTLETYHNLTQIGYNNYTQMLEDKADLILFKHEHPFKWIVQMLKNIIR